MKRILTDAFLKSARPPTKGRSEVADIRCSGLGFRMTANGARSWSFRFRDPITGKTTRKGLGVYPDVSLSEARDAADIARKAVAKGINPLEADRRERKAAPLRTFGVLADRYLSEHADRHKRERSAAEDRRNLKLHVLPKWAKRDYRTIRRADLIELVEGIIKAGKPTAANRVHSLCAGVFSFAVQSDLMDANPLAHTPKRGQENRRERCLSDPELRLFWKNIVLPPVSVPVGLALRLALLTGTRAGEAAGAAVDELSHIDRQGFAVWTLPGLRTKNGRPHLVPLSPLAVSIIKSGLQLSGGAGPFVFPSRSNAGHPITGHALAVAMARFADSLTGANAAVKSWKAKPATPHDLRRTAATRLAELRVPKEIRDRCLNHTPTDVGSRHYNLHDYQDEKRDALNRWALALGGVLADSAGKAAVVAA